MDDIAKQVVYYSLNKAYETFELMYSTNIVTADLLDKNLPGGVGEVGRKTADQSDREVCPGCDISHVGQATAHQGNRGTRNNQLSLLKHPVYSWHT